MSFWKMFGASVASVFVGIVVITLIIVFSLTSLFSSFKVEGGKMPENVVLYLDFSENVVDSPRVSMLSEIDPINMTISQPLTILQVLSAIESAAIDPNVKALCIRQNGMGTISTANIEELRAAIEAFKLSGKHVIAYDEIYTQSEYYLASAASYVLMHPEGTIDWHGLSFTPVFFKGLLDKVDAKVDTFRPKDCKYKSGVEPFIMTKMSDANRKQMNALAESIWNSVVEDVAISRLCDKEILKEAARQLDISTAEDALIYGLIDEIAYEDGLYDLYEKLGVGRNEFGDFNCISIGEYINIQQSQQLATLLNSGLDTTFVQSDGTPLVAIIYADGEIVDGNMVMDDYVFSSTLASQLRQARLDNDTKAVVVRINSPGGSAIASDVIWREMSLLRETKPLVVSMGEAAASGGYYMSVPADYIFANRTTLTGSIGVFGLNINLENTLKNMLGITFDEVATSSSAGGISPIRPITTEQRQQMEQSVDRIYNTFVQHVADGRNLDKEYVYDIAEGRVWSGDEAKQKGLVDSIGGLVDAIYWAADLADVVQNFAIYEFTPPMTSIEQWAEIISSLFLSDTGVSMPKLGEQIEALFMEYPYVFTYQGIKAMMPVRMSINL